VCVSPRGDQSPVRTHTSASPCPSGSGGSRDFRPDMPYLPTVLTVASFTTT
jgi:hypothetical protein